MPVGSSGFSGSGTAVLVMGEDYTLTYSNNTEIGTGTVTITGKGNYTGIKELKFSIKGEIDSIQRASGAKSSLFPPENAVGSFVKIVQRIPVKIIFTEKIDPEEYNIVPGMSVVPKVKVK